MKKTLKRLAAANTEYKTQNEELTKRDCENVRSSGLLSGFHWSKLLIFLTVILIMIITLTPMVVFAADNTASLIVEQVYSASSGAADATFTYRLKAHEKDTPMPSGGTADGYTFRITGSGSAVVGPISYSSQGIYRYSLYQVIAADNSSYTFDRRVYMIEVHVDESLNAYVIVKNANGTKVGSIVFINSYDPGDPPGPTDPPDPPPTDPPPTTPPPTTPPPTTPPPTTPPPTTPPPTPPPPTPTPVTPELPEPQNPVDEFDFENGNTPGAGVDPPITDNGLDIDDGWTPATGLYPSINLPNAGIDGPKTGDDSNTLFDIILFSSGGLLFMIAIVVIIRGRKRSRGQVINNK